MRLILSIIFLCAASLLSAQSIGVDDALRSALTSNPQLRAQAHQLDSLERDDAWSIQKLYPTVTAGLGWQKWNETDNQRRLVAVTPAFQSVFFTPDSESLGAAFGVQWTLTVASFAAMVQAKAEKDVGVLRYDSVRLQLIHDVKATFWRAVALRQAHDLALLQETNARTRLKQSQVAFDNGSGSELTLLQARVAAETRTADRRNAQVALEKALYGLAVLMGKQPGEATTLVGEMSPATGRGDLDAKALVDRYRPRQNDLRMLDAQERKIDAQVLQLQATAIPQVVFAWNADPGINNPRSVDVTKPQSWKQTGGAWSVQLQWKLDSFLPGSALWTLGANLDDFKKSLAANREYAGLALVSQVRSIVDQIEKARGVLPALGANERDARRAAALASAAFEAGARSILEVQDADLVAQSAALALLGEKLNLTLAWIDLESTLNLSQEDLDELQNAQ